MDGGVGRKPMRLVLVEWEDIVGITHATIPKSDRDLKQYQLIKHTMGYLIELDAHVVVVTDYDVTHDGGAFGHNDFTIIPRGVIKTIVDLIEQQEIGTRPSGYVVTEPDCGGEE